MMEKETMHWATAPLGDLISFVIGGDWGKAPEKDLGDDYKEAYCIRGSELRNWREEKGSSAALRLVKKSSLIKRELQLGDILLEISGGGPDQPVGRTVIIDEDVLNQVPEVSKVCTNFFRLVRLSPELDKKYVNYYLQYFYHSGEVVNYQGGSNNLRNLKFKEYSNIQIPLAPLPEQKRIVAKLDALFGHLEVLRDRLDRIPELLKNFRQQVLTQAVTGKLTEEWRGAEQLINWQSTSIGTLFKVQTGATPKRGNSDYYNNGNVPWLKSGQVRNEFIYEAEEFITEKAISETNTKIFPTDTLLVAMYGEGKTRGQVGWMKIPAATNQAIAALVNTEMAEVTRQFVYYFCLSQYNEIREQAEGGNQPNLNLSKIKNWKLQMPPIEEQEVVVKQVQEVLLAADQIEALYQGLKERIDKLPQAVLNKAFKGELVEQRENDEPAEVLLERIKAEKEGKVYRQEERLGMVAEGDTKYKS